MSESLKKIISGGQTGADRGALDAAISREFPHGGAVPAGRKSESGPLPLSYIMEELASEDYPDRTEKNVRDAHATLILSHGDLSGGSALTEKIADRLVKPCLHVDFNILDMTQAVTRVSSWLDMHRIKVLNVAGPRASSDSRIYELSRTLIISLLKQQ